MLVFFVNTYITYIIIFYVKFKVYSIKLFFFCFTLHSQLNEINYSSSTPSYISISYLTYELSIVIYSIYTTVLRSFSSLFNLTGNKFNETLILLAIS